MAVFRNFTSDITAKGNNLNKFSQNGALSENLPGD